MARGVNALRFDYAITVFILSLLPAFEPRYAVLIGLKIMSPFEAVTIALLATLILSFVLSYAMPFIDSLAHTLAKSGNPFLSRAGSGYLRYVHRVRNRVKPYVSRYGFIGLVLFVAIPLPATGIWTGALAAYILGIEKWRTAIALLLGGLISMTITASLALLVP